MLSISSPIKHTIPAIFLVLTNLISLTAPSLPALWFWIEINMVFFVMFVFLQGDGSLATKYFFTQAIFSTMMLASFFLTVSFETPLWADLLFLLSVMAKLGVPPFAIWFMAMAVSSRSMIVLYFLLTVQKVAPLYALSLSSTPIPKPFIFLSIVMVTAWTFVAPSFPWLVAVSSVFNSNWMIFSLFNLSLSLSFLFIYAIQLLFLFNLLPEGCLNPGYPLSTFTALQALGVVLILLSLSGFPPLIGFIPKMASSLALFSLDDFTFLLPIILVASLFILLMYLKFMVPFALGTSFVHATALKVSHYAATEVAFTILFPLALLWA